MSNIRDIFYKHKRRYGYRRITLELRNNGLNINHKKVKRLMSKMGLYSPVRRAKYKSYKGTIGKVAPNILQRNFVADKPNIKWVTDVSEFHISTGKVYLSPILDLYNSEIVSYSVSTNPSFNQTKEMITKAYYIQIKDGNIKCFLIKTGLKKKESCNQCLVKATV